MQIFRRFQVEKVIFSYFRDFRSIWAWGTSAHFRFSNFKLDLLKAELRFTNQEMAQDQRILILYLVFRKVFNILQKSSLYFKFSRKDLNEGAQAKTKFVGLGLKF